VRKSQFYGSTTKGPRRSLLITLPTNIREKYGVKTGDTFRLIDLDGVFVLTPMAPMVPALARKIEQARLEAGLSIDDLLHSLHEQRQRYSQEKCGDVNNPGN
jgi:bifunctional DNA-binding transcriptional regulator/antitoxin component of YhaV-PrlF toxin-antitoxin module